MTIYSSSPSNQASISAVETRLGLFTLVFDGQNIARGIEVGGSGPPGTLVTDDITVQRCRGAAPGSALFLAFGAAAKISNSAFLRNGCDNCPGGAIQVLNSIASFFQVRMHA